MTPQQEERIYDWDAVTVGHDSPPMEFHVTIGVIADYCTAIGNDNPIYRDEAAARAAGFLTIPSPPTMVHRYAPERRQDIINSRGYIAYEQSKGAPRTTPFVSARINFRAPVFAGDTVTSVTTAAEKYERKGNKFVVFHVTGHNQRGELVADHDYICIWEYAKGRKTR